MSSSDIPEPSEDDGGPEDPVVAAGREVVTNLYGAAVASNTARFLSATPLLQDARQGSAPSWPWAPRPGASRRRGRPGRS